MKRVIIPVILVVLILFSSSTFVTAADTYEWVIQTGDRYDYSWTVYDYSCTGKLSCGEVELQENIYVIIDELAAIQEDIDPADIWTLSETGFNVSMFWSNGTEFDISEVPQPFGFNLLPVGNWSQLIDAFPIDAGFLNDETIFTYEYYDLVAGDGIHKEVKFQKSNGVLELYRITELIENIPVSRLNIELISSSPETTPTTSTNTSPTSNTSIPPINLIIITASGSVAVLAIAIFVIRKRV